MEASSAALPYSLEHILLPKKVITIRNGMEWKSKNGKMDGETETKRIGKTC